jgi:hypothetical protein
MSAANEPTLKKGTRSELVTVNNWTACYNSGDGAIVLSCTVTAADGSASITGVGLILNTADGTTLASFYTSVSGGSETVNPALNLPAGNLKVGQTVEAVVSGECEDHHYFFEEKLTITTC